MKRLSFLFFLILCLTFLGSANRTGIQNEHYSKALLDKSNLSIFSLFSSHNSFESSNSSELKTTFTKADGTLFQKIGVETPEEPSSDFRSKVKFKIGLSNSLANHLLKYLSRLIGTYAQSFERSADSNSIESILQSIRVLRI